MKIFRWTLRTQSSRANIGSEHAGPWLATVMQVSPTMHFVSLAQAILYRGAGFAVVWQEFLIVALIGGVFLALALLRFRSVVATAT
jgi:ABC-2 type transport system permease protein